MCGIIGIIGQENVSKEIYYGLTALQHRGQDGAGIVTFDQNHDVHNSGVYRKRGLGLVKEIFNGKKLDELVGCWGIGHVRYPTIGSGNPEDTQPMFVTHPGLIAMGHNGNIVNYVSLKKILKTEQRRTSFSDSDLEVILNLFAEGLSKGEFCFENLCHAVEAVYQQVSGSYSIVSLIAEEGMAAFRDPQGIKPLLYGSREKNGKNEYAFASENHALTSLGFREIKDVLPGELIFVDKELKINRKQLREIKHRHCAFEYVYFADADSVLEGKSVYEIRKRLGIPLAKRIKELGINADMVVAVPDTGRAAAYSLAHELGVPHEDALIKNGYIGKTFIMPSQEERELAVRLKFKPIMHLVSGKTVVLVDDSIVRSTTFKELVSILKDSGVREVIGASTFPQIICPCYYGIDFQSKEELVAHNRTVEEIAGMIGLNYLIYNTIEDLQAAIGLDDLCLACVNGNYPTDVSEAKALERLRIKDKKK